MIKVMSVCAIVMEITRKMSAFEKEKIKMFCYGIVESQVGSHNYFEIERAKKIDLMRVENLTYLKFKDADFDQCLKWFEEKEY